MPQPAEPATLYHASSAVLDGDVLKTHPNTTLAGTDGHFVFAMDDERMAYAYSMKQNAMTPGIPRMRACLALKRVPCVFMEFKHLLPQLPKGTIYMLPVENFTQVILADGTATSEYVSTADIPLAGIERITDITPDMVMEKGVQIFFMDDTHFPTGDIGAFLKECRKDASDGDAAIVEGVRRLLAEGKLTHLNAERGINPHSTFPSPVGKSSG